MIAAKLALHSGSDAPWLAVACVTSVAASLVLAWLGSDAYQAVLGIDYPIPSTVIVVGLGFAGWRVLSRRSWIPAQASGLDGYRLAVSLGLVLPIPVIIVDWLGGFGPGINVAAPDAVLFYPSVAVVAEFVFHVAPLALAAAMAGLFWSETRGLEIIGLAAAVTVEPVLQVLWGAEASPLWANAYVGLHLLAFNVLGVYLLRRYGVLRVLLYRLSYYAVWHIGWGYLRLRLLFSA